MIHPQLHRTLKQLGLSEARPPSLEAWMRLLEELDHHFIEVERSLMDPERSPDESCHQQGVLKPKSFQGKDTREIVFHTDPYGIWTFLNPAWTVILGHPVEETIGENILQWVAMEDKERLRALIKGLIHGGREFFRNEVRFITSSGEVKWLDIFAQILLEDGRPTGIAGSCLDITARKQAEMTISTYRSRLSSLVENLQVGILLEDENQRVILANQELCRLFGLALPSEALVGQSPTTWQKHLSEACTQPETFTQICESSRLQNLIKTGQRFHLQDDRVLEVDYLPTYVDQEVKGALWEFRDASLPWRQEQEIEAARLALEDAQRTKAEFMSNLSHEIRTPMNGILGMTDLLAETSLDGTQLGYLGALRSSSEVLLAILMDILDFSRIEAGSLLLEQHDLDLGLMLEELLTLMASRAESKDLELILQLAPDLPKDLRGDSLHLRQILSNLLDNALKFSEAGNIWVRVSCLSQEPGKAWCRFEVQDSGIGISQDRIQNIFEPFTQVDASSTRKYGGTGLGLAISKRLAGLMGGDISVRSELGKGSSFCLTLPFPRMGNFAPPLPERLAHLRLLCVDDNAAVLASLQSEIEGWGAHCEILQEPLNLLNKLTLIEIEGRFFDLILLDQEMPGLDGLNLARQIRAQPQWLDLPLILMGQMDTHAILPKAMEAGITAVLSKPIRPSQLRETVLQALGAAEPGSVKGPNPLTPLIPTHPMLIVDDLEINRMVMEGLLSRFACPSISLSSAQEALKYLESESVDLIFMDCQMPGMDGYRCTEEIRKREKATSASPKIIVAMTAHALRGDREKCLEAGMDDYLAKPIRLGELERILDRWLPKAHVQNPRVLPLDEKPQNTSTLDLKILQQFKEMGPKGMRLLERMLGVYRIEGGKALETLQRALREGDPVLFFKTAHALKGESGHMGAHQVMKLSGELEALGRAGDLSNGERLLLKLNHFYQASLEALDTYLDNSSSESPKP